MPHFFIKVMNYTADIKMLVHQILCPFLGLISTIITNPLPLGVVKFDEITKHHRFPLFPVKYIMDAMLITNATLTKRRSSLNKTPRRKLAAIWREMSPLLACMFLGPFESPGECNLSAAVLV